MFLTIPCSLADVHLLPKLAKVIQKLGPYSSHKLLVVPTKAIEQQAREFAESIESLFVESRVQAVELGVTGWPLASNKHFKEVARIVCESKAADAFYFFEPDNTPLAKGWLDQVQAEYIKENKPFWGAVIPTRGWVQGPNGPIAQDGEPHMVGTGVYPPNLHLFSALLKTCDFHMPFNRLPLLPFDTEMRHETVPNAFGTSLIQHNWQTKNYRVEDGQIVCDDMDGITPELSHKKPWDGKAIILHGCKDGSLCDIVLSGKVPRFSPTFERSFPAGTPTPTEQSNAPIKAGHPSFLATKIQKTLNGGKLTAKMIAAKLEISIPEVLEAIAEPNSGLKVAGVVKWVSVA